MSLGNKTAPSSRLLTATATLGLITLIVFILYIGKSLLLPLVIALVIWYVILQFTHFFHQFKIGNHKLPFSLSLVISIIISAAFFYFFILLITSSIGNIINEAPLYQSKLKLMMSYINDWTGGRFNALQLLGKLNLTTIFSKFAIIISNMLSNFTLILIYLLFLLLEANTFDEKLKGICKTDSQYDRINNIFNHIRLDINTFLKAKILLNFIAGIASYFTLLSFHIDYPEFWGVLIFLLHFIPFIGPIIAVIIVMLAVSIQVESLLLFTLLGTILIVIQFIVGNLLEPKMMGNRLNVSPMVILISLAFWGSIWGVVGMFLCVPMMVILTIVLAHFSQTRPVAVMLSAHWRPTDSK